MTKGRKKLIITIIVVIFIVLFLTTAMIFLNKKTDMFKSNGEIMTKYIIDISSQLSNLENELKSDEIEKMKANASNIEVKELKIKHLKQKDTTNENYDSEVNKYLFNQKIIEDKEKNIIDRMTTVSKEEKEIIKINERKEKEEYFVKFPNLYKQYFTGEFSDFEDMLINTGYSKEEISKIKKIDKRMKLGQEEVKKVQEKFEKIFQKHIKNKEVIKTEKDNISIKEKQYQTDRYEIIFTSQEMDDFIIEFLENIKNAEAKEYYNIIEKKIKKIREREKEEGENKITINGIKGITKKITIETAKTKISLIKSTEDEYLKIIIEEQSKEKKEIEIIGKKGNFKVKSINDEKREKKEYSSQEKIEDSKIENEIKYLYEYKDNEIEVIQKRDVEKKVKIENEKIEEKNIIDFRKNSKEKNEKFKEKLKNRIDGEISNIKKETNKSELIDTFYMLGILNEQDIINTEEISNIEVERFNYKFELIKGKNIERSKVIELVKMISERITEIEQDEKGNLKLKIEEKENDDEEKTKIINEITEKINSNEESKCNIGLSYDEKSKKVYQVSIDIVNEKEEENI